jgi:hypothetical protein
MRWRRREPRRNRSAQVCLSLLKIRFGSIESQDKQRATRFLRGSTLIAMMQAANLREGNNVIARAG